VWAAALIGLLGLGACSRQEPPAPVELLPVSRSLGAPAPALAGPTPGTERGSDRATAGARDIIYQVERGDTAYAVARRFDIPVKAIIDANNLQPPYGLQAGQRLTIPRPRAHLVQAGDTVQSVAHRYGVDVSALVHANDLPPPFALQPGQRLILPAPVAGATQQAAAPAPLPPMAPLPPPSARAVEVEALAPPAGPPTAAPPPPAPAAAPPPAASAPATAAATPAPVPIPPQAPLPAAKPAAAVEKPPPPVVPSPTVPPATATPPPAAQASASAPASAAASVPAVAPTSEHAPQLAAIPAPATDAVEPPPAAEPAMAPAPHDTTPVGPPPPRAGKTFLWPLRGRVISTYGEQGQGLHNDGINIAAPRGTPIHAAENGVVAYAGNEIRGFGNLLLIRHAGGYMTAYAHADTLLVKRGDTVHRGQVIARVGATGSVTEPQLHFEIREGSQAVDPQRYLGSPSA
jgi:murein DD-endopeptidase MepM/ murein hydrolase activator NlpD